MIRGRGGKIFFRGVKHYCRTFFGCIFFLVFLEGGRGACY